MLLLRVVIGFGRATAPRSAPRVLVAAAAQQRGRRRRPGRRRSRTRTPRRSPVAERPGDQVREEGAAGERARGRAPRARPARALPSEVLDRVVAEEGGEQDRDRRRVRDALRDGAARRRAPRARRSSRAAACAASPTIISVKKIPIEITWAEFWKVWFIPPPAPRSPGGRLFITAARLGEANMPHRHPDQQQDRGEHADRRSRSAAASAARS